MADRAEVVPLRRRGAPEFGPAEVVVDAAEGGRDLSVTWSPDGRLAQLSIGSPDGERESLILDADDVLDLVRALVEGLPEPAGGPRPPATVVPLKPRQSQPPTGDS